MLIINKYGADPIRLFLMNSPLVKGESLNFKEKGINEIVKNLFIPWYHLCRLLLQEINRYETVNNKKFEYNESLFTSGDLSKFQNLNDQWILAKTQSLIDFVHQEFKAYRLDTVLDKKLRYLNELAKWYVNLNKDRFKGRNGILDSYTSLNVLVYCFLNCIICMAPFVPFTTDYFYQNLRKYIPTTSKLNEQSIHFLRIPHSIKEF